MLAFFVDLGMIAGMATLAVAILRLTDAVRQLAARAEREGEGGH